MLKISEKIKLKQTKFSEYSEGIVLSVIESKNQKYKYLIGFKEHEGWSDIEYNKKYSGFISFWILTEHNNHFNYDIIRINNLLEIE